MTKSQHTASTASSRRATRTVLALALLLVPIVSAGQETVTHYTTDAIGSVRMVTDSGGAVIARYDYRPFGDPCGSACGPQGTTEKRQFAGTEKDAETSLDYFGARYYANQTGRFTTVDPVLNVEAASTDPQRWNRYAYTWNRPLVMIDPDGREAGYIYLPNGRMVSPYDPRFPRSQHPVRDTVALAAAISAGIFGGAILGSALEWFLVNPATATAGTVATAEVILGVQGPTGMSSGDMGKLIGWGTGQGREAVEQTVRVSRDLTVGRIAELARQGVTREWVQQQLTLYRKKLAEGGRGLDNDQLVPRIDLMERLLQLWSVEQ